MVPRKPATGAVCVVLSNKDEGSLAEGLRRVFRRDRGLRDIVARLKRRVRVDEALHVPEEVSCRRFRVRQELTGQYQLAAVEGFRGGDILSVPGRATNT